MGLFRRFHKRTTARDAQLPPQAERHFEILMDSMELLHTTTYPDTFFSRYSIAVEEAQTVIRLCGRKTPGDRAAAILQALQADKAQYINGLLRRCNAAGQLPLMKDAIVAHRTEMPPASYELLLQLLAQSHTEEDPAEYSYCSVVFQKGGRSYYYLCDQADLHCGDHVIVPVGAENEHKTAQVVRIERFCGSDAPIAPSRLKHIIDVL